MGIPKWWIKEAKSGNCSGKDRWTQVRRRTNLAQKLPLIYNAQTISSHVTGEKPEPAFRRKVGIHREA
jgi:hypothetical protein